MTTATWRCPWCADFMTAVIYEQHVLALCPKKYRRCQTCDQVVEIADYRRHLRSGCPRPCDTCSTTVPAVDYRRHLKESCRRDMRRCRHCRELFPTAEHKRHLLWEKGRGDDDEGGSSLWTASGGLPSLGKRR